MSEIVIQGPSMVAYHAEMSVTIFVAHWSDDLESICGQLWDAAYSDDRLVFTQELKFSLY